MGTILIANCSVKYEGRASSTLEDGDYLIIIKDDNTMQIQGQKLTKPLNYINAKTIYSIENKIIAKSLTPSLSKSASIDGPSSPFTFFN